MYNVDFPPAPEPSGKPIPNVDPERFFNTEEDMPNDPGPLTDPLTEAERSDLCALLDRIDSGVGEELSDIVLDGLTARAGEILNRALPWWARWVPVPLKRIRDSLDEHFPQILLDPLKDALGCPTSSRGRE